MRRHIHIAIEGDIQIDIEDDTDRQIQSIRYMQIDKSRGGDRQIDLQEEKTDRYRGRYRQIDLEYKIHVQIDKSRGRDRHIYLEEEMDLQI